MLQVEYTNRFKKDYTQSIKRGWDITQLDSIIIDLADEKPLDPKYKDHPLTGNWIGHRECHIKPDWLLIYRLDNVMVTFVRTGTHSDLF